MHAMSESYEYFRSRTDPKCNRGIRDRRIFYIWFLDHINFNIDTSIVPMLAAAETQIPVCTENVSMLNIYPRCLDAMTGD